MSRFFSNIKKSSTNRDFTLLIVGAIVISFILVVIAMALYLNSGAAQLDLSRPSYQAVRKKALKSERFDGFDSSKPLDKNNLDNFEKLYKQKRDEVRSTADALSSDALSDKALEIKLE